MQKESKIVEKVRRLMALAESGNVHEAANAAAAAQRLMAEHRISEAMLAVEAGEDENDIVVTDGVLAELGRKSPWIGTLAMGLSKANGCRVYYNRMSRGVKLRIVGGTSDVQTVTYLYTYLVREVDRLCDAESKSRRLAGVIADANVRMWRASFRAGAAHKLAERIDAAAQEQRRVQHNEAIDAGGTALVRLDGGLARLATLAKKVEDAVPGNLKKGRQTNARRDYSGFAAGERAGASVSLTRGGPALGSGVGGKLRG